MFLSRWPQSPAAFSLCLRHVKRGIFTSESSGAARRSSSLGRASCAAESCCLDPSGEPVSSTWPQNCFSLTRLLLDCEFERKLSIFLLFWHDSVVYVATQSGNASREVVCISWAMEGVCDASWLFSELPSTHPALSPLWNGLFKTPGCLKASLTIDRTSTLTRGVFQPPLLKLQQPTPDSGYTRYSDQEMKASLSVEMHRSSSGECQLYWYKRAGDFVSKILCHHFLGGFSGRSSRGEDRYKEVIHSGKGESGAAALGL